MKKLALILLPATIFCFSCSSTVNKFFGNRTPHETYADKIKKDPAGLQWQAVADAALDTPQPIELPYRHRGYFPAGKPRALGLKFSAKTGQRIHFEVTKDEGENFILFADLYKRNGTDVSHLIAADTNQSSFEINIDEAGDYVLRLQPGLERTGEYLFSASVAPSLAFPVAGNKAKTGSFWGDSRDAGKRRHEGIDIFAPKLTPAIAAADGYITRVGEGGIGGKTVWMNVAGRDIHLYYAHLDKQLVQDGQQIKKGDTLGLVGNTGNAQYTPAHLHFGVYNSDGPIDPFPFVNTAVESAPAIKSFDRTSFLEFDRSAKAKKTSAPKTTGVLIPLAISADGYIAEQPDGSIITAPFSSVRKVKVNGAQQSLANDHPASNGTRG